MNPSFRLALLGISVLAALAPAGPPAAAQTASLVYDFGSREPSSLPPVPTPGGLFDPLPLGERLFFTSDASLWVTDGQPNGTRRLNDLCRGACPTGEWVGSLGNLAFFAAGAGPLWRSDGTAQGTFALTPPGWRVVVPVDPSFDPTLKGGTASLGGRFYFLACQGTGSTCGLWASDGTVGGTRPAA